MSDTPEILDVGADREAGVARCAEVLRAGRLAVIPTDTLYGLAADAFATEGTRALFDAKRRARSIPLPVLVRSPKQVAGLVTRVPETAERLMAGYWPGPLTLVLASDPNLLWDLGDAEGTVAVRMPFDDVALDVIRAVGPLAVTSANLSGQAPAPTAAGAREQLGEGVAVYLDDGPRSATPASCVLDLTRREPAVLREGALDPDEVLAVARGELDPTRISPPERPGH